MSRPTPSLIEISGQGIRLYTQTAGWLTRQIIVRDYGRPLTTGEISLLRPYFNNRVDYSKIKVINVGIPETHFTVTPNGKIFFSGNNYRDDYSQLPDTAGLKWVFIHEICHVWQFQHGYFIKVNASLMGSHGGYRGDYPPAYKYNFFDTPLHFKDYNLEQQASIIEHYAILLNNQQELIKRLIPILKQYPQYINTLKQYVTQVVSEFLDTNNTDETLLPTSTNFADMESHIKKAVQEVGQQMTPVNFDLNDIPNKFFPY